MKLNLETLLCLFCLILLAGVQMVLIAQRKSMILL